MMVTLKEVMNEVEKTKYESFRRHMMEASTYTEIFYFGWRAKRVLKQSRKRALTDMDSAK